jgi:hypothetical protein
VLEGVGEYCAENLGFECSGGGFERAASTLRETEQSRLERRPR